MHNIISKWAPPDEKGKFVAALLGGNLGTVFTFQLSGILTPLIGWRMVFYGEAALILIVTILWIVLVTNTPSVHSFISPKELQYIEQSLPNISKKKVKDFSENFLNEQTFWSSRNPFLDCATVLQNNDIACIHRAYDLTLWQFMGTLFPVDHCTRIHGRCSWFQLSKCWYLFKFAAFGSILSWIRVWLDWWLLATKEY